MRYKNCCPNCDHALVGHGSVLGSDSWGLTSPWTTAETDRSSNDDPSFLLRD